MIFATIDFRLVVTWCFQLVVTWCFNENTNQEFDNVWIYWILLLSFISSCLLSLIKTLKKNRKYIPGFKTPKSRKQYKVKSPLFHQLSSCTLMHLKNRSVTSKVNGLGRRKVPSFSSNLSNTGNLFFFFFSFSKSKIVKYPESFQLNLFRVEIQIDLITSFLVGLYCAKLLFV